MVFIKTLFNGLKLYRFGNREGQTVLYFPGYNTNLYACPYHIPNECNVYVIFPADGKDKNRSSGFEPYYRHGFEILKKININTEETILVGFSNGGIMLSSYIFLQKFKAIIINSPVWYLPESFNVSTKEAIDNYNLLNQGKVIVTINKKEKIERQTRNIFDKYKPEYLVNEYGHSPKVLMIAMTKLLKDINKENNTFSLF